MSETIMQIVLGATALAIGYSIMKDFQSHDEAFDIHHNASRKAWEHINKLKALDEKIAKGIKDGTVHK